MTNVNPYGSNVVIDSAGNLYYLTPNLILVKQFFGTQITQVLSTALSGWTFYSSLKGYTGYFIGIDLQGNIIVPYSSAWPNTGSTAAGGAIWKFSPTGVKSVISRTVTTNDVWVGAGTAATVDSSNNIYWVEWVSASQQVVKVLSAQTQVISLVFGSSTSSTCTVGPATTTGFGGTVQQIVTDSTGNVYVAAQGCNTVIMWNRITFLTNVFAGTTSSSGSTGDGGPATLAKFNKPFGLAMDKNSNNMYISDYGVNTVRRVNLKTGIIRSDHKPFHKITTS